MITPTPTRQMAAPKTIEAIGLEGVEGDAQLKRPDNTKTPA
jgi:hypothetical protein